MTNSLLYKKIAGSVYGGAIGDALGGPLEGKDDQFITSTYGGPITTLVPYDEARGGAANLSAEAGTYTDDTRLKNLLCQAIIEKSGRVTAEDLASVWLREMNPQEFFVTEQIAYLKLVTRARLMEFPYAKEINPSITARDFGRNTLPACDANMMISPIGLINACDPHQAALDAYEVSLLFQSGYAASSCSVIAAAVAEAMRREATWQTVLNVARAHADAYTALFLSRVLDAAEGARDIQDFKQLFYDRHLVHFVDPMEVVPAAFGIFVVCGGDFRKCVIEAANFGRDCDTIAGIVGSISGALHGVDAIAADWVETVRRANPAPDLDEQVAGLYNALTQEVQKARERIDALGSYFE
jgi:ADP-ribosylglycohydrolase